MASAYPVCLVPKTVVKNAGTTASAISTASVPVLCYQFTVQAKTGNTGTLYVGTASVDATSAIHIAAGASYTFPALYTGTHLKQYDLTQWYVRASAENIKAAIVQVVEERQLS